MSDELDPDRTIWVTTTQRSVVHTDRDCSALSGVNPRPYLRADWPDLPVCSRCTGDMDYGKQSDEQPSRILKEIDDLEKIGLGDP